MNSIQSDTVLDLTGFDSRGVLVGSARYKLSGPLRGFWAIRVCGKTGYGMCATEQQATDLLREHGAVTVRSDSGMKR